MKKIIFTFFILITFSLTSFSQTYTIEGTQKKMDQNVQFEGQAVYIPVQCKIVSVSGNHSSFALRIDNTTKYQFYYQSKSYSPALNTVIIEPGMYYLYPDLPPDVDSVSIKITLEAI